MPECRSRTLAMEACFWRITPHARRSSGRKPETPSFSCNLSATVSTKCSLPNFRPVSVIIVIHRSIGVAVRWYKPGAVSRHLVSILPGMLKTILSNAFTCTLQRIRSYMPCLWVRTEPLETFEDYFS